MSWQRLAHAGARRCSRGCSSALHVASRQPLGRRGAASEALPPRLVSVTSVATLAPSLLPLLVCPLSKEPLRYRPETHELVNERLGVAYPVVDGIPQLSPSDGRLLKPQD